jgi:prolyl-tRNA editing enzyme YbaK/EbsC (Cys-tRNA(Pro) deacylase)
MFSPSDLQAFMLRQSITGEILPLNVPTPTVETAAQAVGAQPEQIVKSILFLVRELPVLAVACGLLPVERRAIAAHYGVGRKQVKLADAAAVLQQTGYAVGAMPPFGHRQPLPTLLDKRVLEQAVVFAGGGAENTLLRLNPADLLAATQATVLDLTLSGEG